METVHQHLHEALFDALARANDQVALCSPFLSTAPANRLAGLADASASRWRILTVLDPVNAAYKYLSLDGLDAMLKANFEVRHADRLHAKVFLVDGTSGFAGSANLTSAGLGSSSEPNLELSISLSPEQCREVSSVFEAWWADANPVNSEVIEKCRVAAKQVAIIPTLLPGAGEAVLRREEIAAVLIHESGQSQNWIKALTEPVAEPDGTDMWFQNHDKALFEAGNLVLLYEKSQGVCTAIVEVLGETVHNVPFQLSYGRDPADASKRPWVTPARIRFWVPPEFGVTVDLIEISAGPLERGRMKISQDKMEKAIKHMMNAGVGAN